MILVEKKQYNNKKDKNKYNLSAIIFKLKSVIFFKLKTQHIFNEIRNIFFI